MSCPIIFSAAILMGAREKPSLPFTCGLPKCEHSTTIASLCSRFVMMCLTFVILVESETTWF